MDLVLFAVILLVSQGVITFSATHWFSDQLYIVSPVAAVAAIVMMRWGGFAALHAALGGAAICFFSGGSCKHLLVYAVGNLLCMLMLLMLKKLGKQAVRDHDKQSLLFAAGVQLLMMAGRALMALIVGFGWQGALGYITTDSLSIVFTLVLIWIARRVDGLFEDQKHYLRRIQNEG